MTVDAAFEFFAEDPQVRRSLDVLRQVGLGYLRLGQPATELSGGEAQRIRLATELQRTQRGDTLYVLDEPTTRLHPADVERLIAQLDGLGRVLINRTGANFERIPAKSGMPIRDVFDNLGF